MIAPILITVLSKNNIFTDIGFSLFIISIILLYAIVFWLYMDRPPSNITDITKVPEELRGGWFSFENPLRVELLVACSITSMTITSIIKFLVNRKRYI
jgi:heme/copper-type cytochrome/quinol oxidase subunit 3